MKNVINTALKNASQFKPSTVCIFIYIMKSHFWNNVFIQKKFLKVLDVYNAEKSGDEEKMDAFEKIVSETGILKERMICEVCLNNWVLLLFQS